MEFRILGPIEAVESGRSVALGPAKQRALLAVLLVQANEVVSIDRLIDELWGERPPAKAAKSVQVYVSQLRKVLGDGRLETSGRGYVLHVQPGALDSERFQGLLAEGREALARAEASRAAETLRAALALWRGPALSDVAYEPFAEAEIARLEELQLGALEERIDADLALGRHAELVAELEDLVRAEPLRERLRGQLMLALYRSGRQAEALDAYREARRVLVERLGLEPSRALQELERAILRQDEALEVAHGAGIRLRAPPKRASLMMIGAALLLLAALSAAIVELTRGGSNAGLASVEPDSAAVIDPSTGDIVRSIPVGARPTRIAAGEGALWTADFDGRTVSRIDPRARRVVTTLGTGATPVGLAAGEGSVWVANEFAGTVLRIDPGTNTIIQTFRVGGEPVAVAAGAGAVWIVDAANGTVLRLDPTTGARKTIRVGNGPTDVAVGAGSVWVANGLDETVSRLDPVAGAPIGHAIALRFQPARLAAGDGSVWVTGTLADEIARIDPSSDSVASTSSIGDGPAGLALGAGSVWVAESLAHAVVRLDPHSGDVLSTIDVGANPDSIAVANGTVWVTVRSP
jgi:DNA-binding SARP family transcriptional activator/streptogramin lyase